MTFIHLLASWLILLYTALGIYSLVWAMTLKQDEMHDLSFLHKFMYWNGIVFAMVIPVAMAGGLAAVLTIAIAGALPF